MLILSIHQFRSSWQSWSTGSFIFVIAGWLIGFCLMGIDTLNTLPLNTQYDPRPLFIMPLVFGGITLLFVLSNVIRMILSELQNEYQLWVVLGANLHQLTILIMIQMGMIAFISGWAGYGLSILTISPLYGLLQSYIGHIWLPDVGFKASVGIGLLTSLTLTGIAMLSGLINTRRLVERQHQKRLVSVILYGVALVGLAVANYQVLVNRVEKNNGGILFMLLFWLILVQFQVGQPLMTWISKKAQRLVPSGLIKLASCRATVTTTISGSILALQSLIYGLIILLFGLGGSGGKDIKNVIVSFIVYIGAPGLLIVANLISMAMLSGRQQKSNLQQLNQLGLSGEMMLVERGWECLFQVIPLFMVATVTNFTLYGLLAILAWHTQVGLQIDLATTVWIPVAIVAVTWMLLTSIAWKEVYFYGRLK